MNKSNNNSRLRAASSSAPKGAKKPSPKGAAKSPGPLRAGVGKQAAAASAYATGVSSVDPWIQRSSVSSCRIRHREFLTNVTGTASYTVANSFALNPGMAATFPWLSSQAVGWERYRFNRLKFCFYTRTGSNIPGSVLLSPDYDAADAAPASEQIASTYEGTVEDAPWKDISCTLRPEGLHPKKDELFVRTAALSSNLDIKTYDAGILHLCTVDGTAVAWGKLWVEYDVEFFTPQLPPTGQVAFAGGSVLGATNQTAANPFGDAPAVDAQSLGLSMSALSVLSFSVPGTYLLTFLGVGSVISAVTPTAGAGATILANPKTVIDSGALNVLRMDRVVISSVTGGTIAYALTATTVTTAYVAVALAPTSSLA